MGKRLYKVYAFAIAVAFVIFLLEISPIGVKTDEIPYMVKQFEYSDCSILSSIYISSSACKKKVEEIEIVDPPCEASCVIDSQFSDLCNSQRVTRLEWSVEYDNEKYPGDFSFSEIMVTWSDGSKSKVDLGYVTLTGRIDSTCIDNEYSFEKPEDGEEYEEPQNMVMKSDAAIRLWDVPHKDQINMLVEGLRICGRPLDYFTEGKSITLSKGDELDIEGSFVETKEYGLICAIIPIEIDYTDGSKQWSSIYISQKLSNEEAVIIGLNQKRKQEQENE